MPTSLVYSPLDKRFVAIRRRRFLAAVSLLVAVPACRNDVGGRIGATVLARLEMLSCALKVLGLSRRDVVP